MNDCQFPWLILVPRVNQISEIYQLDLSQRQQLERESTITSMHMVKHYAPDKMNIAALGNVVNQLHIHHIARYKADLAWPAPVWGKQPSLAYSPGDIQSKLIEISQLYEKSELEFKRC